jgi:hypothetical protein
LQVQLGNIEIIPLPTRGSPGWLAARQAQAAEAIPNRFGTDTVVESIKVPQWGIHTERTSGRQTLVKRLGFEETRFESAEDAVRCGCPTSVAGLLRTEVDLENLKAAAQYASEKAKQEREAADRLDRIRTTTSLFTLGRKVKP